MINPEDVNETLYHIYQRRINQIHGDLRQLCIRAGFHIVTYDNIEHGKKQVEDLVKAWMQLNDE